MIKKNQFFLIFLTIVTILAVWYIKTPTTAQTNNELTNNPDEVVSETTRLAAFQSLREVIRAERSLETAKYDDILADNQASIEEKAVAKASKDQISSLTEKELVLELQVINLGYRDAFVHVVSNGVEVTVISEDVSASKANEIILMTLNSFDTEADSVVVNFAKLEDYHEKNHMPKSYDFYIWRYSCINILLIKYMKVKQLKNILNHFI